MCVVKFSRWVFFLIFLFFDFFKGFYWKEMFWTIITTVPVIVYEGGLKSFRPNNDTRHFFSIFFFIFLHSLLVTLHTSPSDAPISLTHQNSTRRFFLQNNCSRRWLPPHLKKTSVVRGQFLDEGPKRSRLGLDLVSMADGQAVQTVIHGFSPWRPLRCETAQTSKRGTQRADSFLMPESWCNMWQTRSLDIFITSAISLTLIRRSSSPIWWTLAMLSSAVAVFGRPERSSSPKLLRPRLNSAAQNFTVVNDGALSPYTVSNSTLICVGVLPFKNKYLMTARYSIFSIFTKTLTSTHSNDCQLKTARPNWLQL